MFEKFLRANAGDFRQRYEGTFGFYRDEKGKRTLCKLSGIGDSYCEFIDARGVEFTLNADSEKDIGFEFIPPESKFYNTLDSTYLVNRVAARQFQRGISGKNINIFQLQGDRLNAVSVGFSTLSRIYENPKLATEVLDRLNQAGVRENGFALSGAIAFGFSVVYLYDRVIGTYETTDFRHFKVTLDEPELWRTEIRDALRRLNKTVEIVE